MSSSGVRTQRSVVDTVAQRGYDRIVYLEKKRQLLKDKPVKHCSHTDCKVRLSRYNDTDYCAQHQSGNISIPKFL